jgi:hypothetical protein
MNHGLSNRILSRQPSVRLAAPGPSDPEEAVRQFIQNRRAVWNLAEEDAAAVQVRSVSRTGPKTAQLFQSVDGVEVALDDGKGWGREQSAVQVICLRRAVIRGSGSSGGTGMLSTVI